MKLVLSGIVGMLLVTSAACSGDEGRQTSLEASATFVDGVQTESASSEPEPSPEQVTLEEALRDIGAKCDQLVGDTDCTVAGTAFVVSVIAAGNWDQNEALRDRACDQGYINPGYVIATDGETFTLATDFNDDTKAIAKALSKTGLDLEVVTYCP